MPNDQGQTPAFPHLARPRDPTTGRFLKASTDLPRGIEPGLPHPEEVAADLGLPRAGAFEPVEKWAGEPSAGGMGGSINSQDEKPYDPQKKPGPWTEVGASGLAQYGGFVRDEFLLQLQGNNARKVFREMWDNDPIVGSVVFAIQMLVRKVDWRVEPPEAGTVEEIVQARFVERQRAAQERQQAQQQRLMEAQAGLAANSTSATRTGPDGKPAAPAPQRGPVPGQAQGVLSQVGPIHAPIPGRTQAGAARPTPGDITGPPGTNAPATPNAPGSNPSGGVAQDAALQLDPGLPGTPAKPKRKGGQANPGESTTQNDAYEKRRWWQRMRKAASASASGGSTLAMGEVDEANPIDPETGNPMEFAPDTGPGQVTPQAQKNEELAVFVETCFHDMADSWADCLAQIITMIVFGFSFHEVVYKKRNGPNPDFPEQGSRFNDGKIGWSKIAGRAQETLHRWEFDDYGNVMGFWQLAPPKFRLKYIPMSKALLFRTTAYKNNPEGRSILRSAYRPWFFKKRIEEYEAIGVERDLAGLPVAKVPYQYMTSAATGEEVAALNEVKKMVRNLRRNEQEGVVFPALFDPDTKQPMFELELLASPSRRQFDTNEIISRYEQRIAMNALSDFILLGHDSVGARSLGDTKVELFATALEAWLAAIADVFNTYAIPRLMQMNGEDPAESPRLTFGKVNDVPLEQVAEIIQALAGSGADLFPDTQLEDHIREMVGLPPKAASDDL